MPGKSRRDPYEQLFIELCKRVEKILVRAIAGAFALLLVMQLLLQFSWARELLTRVDRLEGVPYRHEQEATRPAQAVAASAETQN